MNEAPDDVARDPLTRRISTAIVTVAVIIMASAYVLTSRYVPERPPVPPAPQVETLPPVPAQLALLHLDTIPPLSSIDVIASSPGASETVASQARPAVSVLRSASVQISGWAVDRNAARPAGTVFIEADDRILIQGQYGIARPDVAASFKNQAFQAVGFAFSFPASELGGGEHSVDLVVLSADGKSYYRAKDRLRLTIR